MKMRFVIDKEEKIILQRFSGELTYDYWLASAEKIWLHPDYDQTYRGIVDFRAADVKMGVPEIKKMIALLTEEDQLALRGDAVVLIDGTAAAAFASIFADTVDADLFTTKIATTEEGAVAKFNLDVGIFEKLYSSRVEEHLFGTK